MVLKFVQCSAVAVEHVTATRLRIVPALEARTDDSLSISVLRLKVPSPAAALPLPHQLQLISLLCGILAPIRENRAEEQHNYLSLRSWRVIAGDKRGSRNLLEYRARALRRRILNLCAKISFLKASGSLDIIFSVSSQP
jgi:hypothetical protein